MHVVSHLDRWPRLLATIISAGSLAACGSGGPGALIQHTGPATSPFGRVPQSRARIEPNVSCLPAVRSTSKLYVADVGKGLIIRYTPPNPNPQTINMLGSVGVDVKFDRLKNMWVDEQVRKSIHGFTPPYNGVSFADTTAPLVQPFGIAFDGTNNMYIADGGGNQIGVLAPPYTSSTFAQTIAVNGPGTIAFDGPCHLFVTTSDGHVLEFAPPYTSPPIRTLSIPGAAAVAVDSHRNLFVGTFDQTQDEVLEFAPPYSGAPIATVTNGVDGALSLALDANADLFVCDFLADDITEYVPPYTGPPVLTLTKRLLFPQGITFGPR